MCIRDSGEAAPFSLLSHITAHRWAARVRSRDRTGRQGRTHFRQDVYKRQAHVRLKVNDGGRIRLRRWLVREFCLADSAVDLPRGGVLPIISTHTSLAGRDSVLVRLCPPSLAFLLTRPLRDVTRTSMI